MEHRNDVSALEALISRGFVVDTMEVAASWRALPDVYERAIAAIRAVEHTMVASAHQSHSYTDGGLPLLHVRGQAAGRTSARPTTAPRGMRASARCSAAGGALSHHHGVGLNRGRFVADALGAGFGVLQHGEGRARPNGILNPGKLGLSGPFGPVPWP